MKGKGRDLLGKSLQAELLVLDLQNTKRSIARIRVLQAVAKVSN